MSPFARRYFGDRDKAREYLSEGQRLSFLLSQLGAQNTLHRTYPDGTRISVKKVAGIDFIDITSPIQPSPIQPFVRKPPIVPTKPPEIEEEGEGRFVVFWYDTITKMSIFSKTFGFIKTWIASEKNFNIDSYRKVSQIRCSHRGMQVSVLRFSYQFIGPKIGDGAGLSPLIQGIFYVVFPNDTFYQLPSDTGDCAVNEDYIFYLNSGCTVATALKWDEESESYETIVTQNISPPSGTPFIVLTSEGQVYWWNLSNIYRLDILSGETVLVVDYSITYPVAYYPYPIIDNEGRTSCGLSLFEYIQVLPEAWIHLVAFPHDLTLDVNAGAIAGYPYYTCPLATVSFGCFMRTEWAILPTYRVYFPYDSLIVNEDPGITIDCHGRYTIQGMTSIFYKDGVRFDNELSEKIGCLPEQIWSIIYFNKLKE